MAGDNFVAADRAKRRGQTSVLPHATHLGVRQRALLGHGPSSALRGQWLGAPSVASVSVAMMGASMEPRAGSDDDAIKPFWVNGRPMSSEELDAEEARLREVLRPLGLPDDVPIFNRNPFDHLVARVEHFQTRFIPPEFLRPPVGYSGAWPPRSLSDGSPMSVALVFKFHAFYRAIQILQKNTAQQVVGTIDVLLILASLTLFGRGVVAGLIGVAVGVGIALALSYPVFLFDRARKARTVKQALAAFESFTAIEPWIPPPDQSWLLAMRVIGQSALAVCIALVLAGCPQGRGANQANISPANASQERETKVLILTYRNDEQKQAEERRLAELTTHGWQVVNTETNVVREPDAYFGGGAVLPGDTITTVTVTLERVK